MKLLLTSGGVTNDSIREALVYLLGKPIDQAAALAIPTAQHGHPMCTPGSAYRFASGNSPSAMTGLGWKAVGLLELLALPHIDPARWMPWVRDADVLLVDGGDATFLAHWMRKSGLAEMLPSFEDKVWVGVSAGSMVMTPRIGEAFVSWKGAPDDRTLGLVDFAIFPHLDYPGFEENTMVHAQEWVATIGVPSYAIDDQTAIKVVDTMTEVVSEGNWRYFG